MKRSEMVEKIADEICRLGEGDDCIEDLTTVSILLDFIEDQGMEPPQIRYWNSPNPKDTDKQGIPKDLNYSPNNGDWLNQWEPEK